MVCMLYSRRIDPLNFTLTAKAYMFTSQCILMAALREILGVSDAQSLLTPLQESIQLTASRPLRLSYRRYWDTQPPFAPSTYLLEE